MKIVIEPRLYRYFMTAAIGSAILAALTGCGGGSGNSCSGLGALVSSAVCSEKGTPAPVTVVNLSPTAVLDVQSGAVLGEGVLIDGSRSADPEGRQLSYTLELVGAPTGSTAQLSNPGASTSVFVPDVVGVYQFRLVVSDGVAQSQPVTSSLTVRRGNTAPIARALAVSPSAVVGQVIALDGSGSHDEDRDLITYSWAMVNRPADSVSVLNGVSSAQPTFLADRAGRYVVSLIVNDGRASSQAATVTIDAGQRNMPPVARVVEVQPVLVGSTVILSGAASSDPNGDNLRYEWSFMSKPAGSQVAALSGDNTVRPSFVPDAEGDYLVKLVVSDGSLSSEPVFARVSATRANQRPSALIVARSGVTVGETVILDGAGSTDPNQDALTYDWVIISKPLNSTAVLQGSTAPKATVMVDQPGQYVVGLRVRDGVADSQLTTHTITAVNGNLPPVAVAESLTPNGKVGTQIVLSGAKSSDPDQGDLISYRWSMISTPVDSNVTLLNQFAVTPSFKPDLPGLYVVGLTVIDSRQATSKPVTVVVQAGINNLPPVARVAAVDPVAVGAIAVLDGSLSADADDDRISYEWKILARPPGSSSTLALVASNTVRPSLTPDVEGDYLVQLVVSDGKVRSEPVIARVTATRPTANRAPVAVISPTVSTVLVGGTVVLDGAASVDPEGGALIHSWTLISRPPVAATAPAPAVPSVTLQGVTAPKATLLADVAGTYVVGLKVRDSLGLESPMTTQVIEATATPRPVAVVGAPQTAPVGRPLELNGLSSIGAGSGAMNFQWTVVSAPGAARIADPTAGRATIVPNATGFWVFRLVVDQGRDQAGVPLNPSLPQVVVVEVI